MLTFNTDNMLQQEFPFPPPIMDYIFKNVSAAQLLKLYKTCKFFYDKFRINIVEDFEICEDKDEEKIVGNSLSIWQHHPSWSKLNNFWISSSFTIFDFKETLQLDHSKFSRLTFDKLEFVGDNFFVEDFKFLVKCPTLRHLICSLNVRDMKTERNLTIKEIIEHAPQVSTFELSHDSVSEEPIDMNKLIALDRQTKITSFHLSNVSKIPDPLLVIEFFKKHALPDTDYYFGFDKYDDDYDADVAKTFFHTINSELRAWRFSLQFPSTLSSSFIDLTGKTAVIIGASEGTGRATVILFRQLGASVIAIARNNFKLKDLTEECQDIKSDGFIHTVSGDSCDFCDEIFERIKCKFGTKLDILVNNFDFSRWYCVPNARVEEDHRDKLYVLRGHLNLIQYATPYLTEAKGTIINVSTSNELIIKPEDKVSIANIERRLKIEELELASSGVRTNTVNSGVSITALPRPHGMTNNDYKKYSQNLKKSHAQQAANAIAFLASDSAKSIEGAVLPVNALNLL